MNGDTTLTDLGLGPGTDPLGNLGAQSPSDSANSDTFQNSNLNQDSSQSEGWRSLSQQMQPSQGSGSGQIDPSTMHNDAQWMRVLSLVVYSSGVTSAQQQANAPVTPSAGGFSVPTGRRVVPFPRPRRRIPGLPGQLDDPAVSSTGYAAQNSTPATGGGQNSNLPGIELSALRCKFTITKTTATTPDVLNARIYNMAPATMAKVIEFTRVRVMAGYKYANFGLIFDGTVVQYRRGKENPTDTYLEIIAADGEDLLRQASIIDTLPAGSEERQALEKINSIRQELAQGNFKVEYQDPKLYTRQTTRDQVLMGQLSNLERQYMLSYGAQHYLDSGQYIMMSKTGYRPGEMVILSPKTGLVGLPEVTPQGIQAKCLLNPKLRLGGIVQIDSNILSGVAFTPGTASQTDANGNVIPGDPTGGKVYNPNLRGQIIETAFTSPVGRYKILLMTYNGDTRGNSWYCDIVCVALNANNEVMLGSNSQSNAWRRAAPEARAGSQVASG